MQRIRCPGNRGEPLDGEVKPSRRQDVMKQSRRGMIGFAAAATALLLITGATTAAQAQSKSVQTEGIWIRYDPDAPAVTVKVVKPAPPDRAR